MQVSRRIGMAGLTLLTGLCVGVLRTAEVRAASGNACVPTTCNAPAPTCSKRTTSGTDNCGGSCSKSFNNYCQAATPKCGQTVTGTWVCGGSCSVSGGSCSGGGGGGGGPVSTEDWRIWGVAMPGDSEYGMVYPKPETRDLVGLAAKGNVVIGDYTSSSFQNTTVPIIQPNSQSNPEGRTHDYSIDPTDANLGYHSYSQQGGVMMFDGNYNAADGGYKLDASGKPIVDAQGNPLPRKFYESSLSDAAFKALAPKQVGHIDAVLFTNHAVAGATSANNLSINGAMIARDEAIVFGSNLTINHDIRLLDMSNQAAQMSMPYGLKRPELTKWEECPTDGCPPLQ